VRPYEVVRTFVPGDGIDQFGLLFRAPGRKKPVPGVILLHGWATPGTVGAALMAHLAFELQQAGYVAMALSLRGWPETGGEDDCAGQQPRDVVKALQWFAQRPEVDSERIALVGHSQGGQVALLVGAMDVRVRAIIAYAPATDLALWLKMTKLDGIRRYVKNVCSRGDGLEVRSPVHVADRIQAPVLMVHGTADERVHIEQSQRMLQAMVQAGRENVLLRVVPDAGHYWGELTGAEATLEFLRKWL
jgi:dipeptidyl aminopeptidase/acylaminoacyl peptidase